MEKWCHISPFEISPSFAGGSRLSLNSVGDYQTIVADNTIINSCTISSQNISSKNTLNINYQKPLSLELCNARSICNKFRLLKDYLQYSKDLDLFFITETWLQSKHLDQMFCTSGFHVIRNDRVNDRRGGGVMLIYKSGLYVHNVTVNYSVPDPSFDLICVDMFMNNSVIRLICVYLPPSQHVEVIDSLCNTLRTLIPHNKPAFVIGDFNLPNIDWNLHSTTGDQSHCLFLDFCSSLSLFQCINYPTHEKGNILDLLLCNYSAKNTLLNHFSTCPPFTTDHLLISAKISVGPHQNTNSRSNSFRNFKLGDYDKISTQITNSNWDFLSSTNSVQNIYNQFCLLLTTIINENIPLKTSNKNKKQKKPKNVKRLLKQKKILYKKSKLDRSFKQAFKQASKNYDLAVNQWHDQIESKLCQDPSSKKFYNFVNSNLKSSSSIPPIRNKDDSLIFSDTEKANCFNSAFQSFFTIDDNSPYPFIPPTHTMPPLQILPSDILSACLKMKKKLSRTPEDIPSFFIVNTINSLLPALTIIFNMILSLNEIPEQWKRALVIPVYKKGDRSNVGNYRPVSLTSSFCRLFEAVIHAKILEHIYNHDLISPHQFGFLPGRSSCNQLLTCLEKWLHSFCNSESTSVLYTDISKAFDSVNHRILIRILYQFGLSAQLVNWIENFLSNRQQEVCISSSKSDPLKVLSGVPQGSVLASLLFIMYINGITDCAVPYNVNVSMFADDNKFFSTNSDDLQQAIFSMSPCLNQLQLKLAHHKCSILKIKKGTVKDCSKFWIDDHQIEELPSVRDLGIFISSDMKWRKHIDYICHKASIKSYQIFKSIRSKNIWTLIKLFTTYIRPQLEYNSQIWSPFLLRDINQIEKIQRHFLKRAFNRCNLYFTGYKDRLKQVNLLSLQDRRIFLDLTFMFKLIHNLTDLNFNNFFSYKTSSYSLRCHSLQIYIKKEFNSSIWSNSFFVRVPKLWNSLPAPIATAESLSSFNSLLKTHLLTLA